MEANFIKQIRLKGCPSWIFHAPRSKLFHTFKPVSFSAREIAFCLYGLTYSKISVSFNIHRIDPSRSFDGYSCRTSHDFRYARAASVSDSEILCLLQLPFEAAVPPRTGGASRVQQGAQSGSRGPRLLHHVLRMQFLPDRRGPREIQRTTDAAASASARIRRYDFPFRRLGQVQHEIGRRGRVQEETFAAIVTRDSKRFAIAERLKRTEMASNSRRSRK